MVGSVYVVLWVGLEVDDIVDYIGKVFDVVDDV